jgi:hypothetical protein
MVNNGARLHSGCMANDNAPDSSRSRIALGVAASAVTLAIATTLAALLGYLGPGGPTAEEPAAQPPAAEPVAEVVYDRDRYHDDDREEDDDHEDDDDDESDDD